MPRLVIPRNFMPLLAVVALSVSVMAGCNTQPEKAEIKPDFSALGDAKSKLEYGTAMPVGSADGFNFKEAFAFRLNF